MANYYVIKILNIVSEILLFVLESFFEKRSRLQREQTSTGSSQLGLVSNFYYVADLDRKLSA